MAGGGRHAIVVVRRDIDFVRQELRAFGVDESFVIFDVNIVGANGVVSR